MYCLQSLKQASTSQLLSSSIGVYCGYTCQKGKEAQQCGKDIRAVKSKAQSFPSDSYDSMEQSLAKKLESFIEKTTQQWQRQHIGFLEHPILQHAKNMPQEVAEALEEVAVGRVQGTLYSTSKHVQLLTSMDMRTLFEYLRNLLIAGYIICNLQNRVRLNQTLQMDASEENRLLAQKLINTQPPTAQGDVVTYGEGGTVDTIVPVSDYIKQSLEELKQIEDLIQQYQYKEKARNQIVEELHDLDYDTFWLLSPMSKESVLKAMDRYVREITGTAVTLEAVCRSDSGIHQKFKIDGQEFKKMAQSSILMGYLICQEEKRVTDILESPEYMDCISPQF